MGVVRALGRSVLVLALVAAVAGVVALVRRPALPGAVSFDDWPDVPRNPAA